MRRKRIIFLICAVLCVSMLAACGGKDTEGESSSAAGTQAGGSFFDGTTEAGAKEAATTAAAEEEAGTPAAEAETDLPGDSGGSEEESTAEIDMSESLDGKTYQWGDCTFILTAKRDCNAEENENFNQFLIPNGKWAIVSFKVVSGSIDADTVDAKLKDNLTLGGSYIATITQRTSQDDTINGFGGVFVVPNDFDTENAALTIIEY